MATDIDVQKAKAFLLQASDTSGMNLYDHLSEIISKVLEERPQNSADTLEDISKKLKAKRFSHKSSTIQVCIYTRMCGVIF